MTDQIPADWHSDPFRRHELRYWNGVEWTEHVVTAGVQRIDPPVILPPAAPSAVPAAGKVNTRIQRELRTTGVVIGEQAGGGTLLTEPVLVVNQKAKLVEVNAEYAVYNQHGRRIGAVREVGQNLLKKAVHADVFGTRRFHIVDETGKTVLSMLVPATVFLSKTIVLNADGTEAGQILQKFGFINVRLSLVARGEKIGSINGEGWDTWNFNVQDATGTEIARITKKWAGLSKEIFTRSDNYVVEIHGSIGQPLRSLIVAAALALDTGFRQGQSKANERASKRAARGSDDGGGY